MALLDRRVGTDDRIRTFESGSTTPGSTRKRLTMKAGPSDRLPTSGDLTVFLSLVKLWREAGRPRSFKFTNYQLAMACTGRGDRGNIYARIRSSIERWRNTEFDYEEESYSVDGSTLVRKKFRILSGPPAAKELAWSDLVNRCLQLPPWPQLDLSAAVKLAPAPRQLFFFLSGWLQLSGSGKIPLARLAYDHMGLSRSLVVGDLKRSVGRGAIELERVGVIKKLEIAKRFLKDAKGQWSVVFELLPRENNGPSIKEPDMSPSRN